jgi:DTW domain-containing protein YfiP
MATRTRIVLLMHPMEWKRERCTTGRITCLNLANSEIIEGLSFDGHPRVRELIDDPANAPFLLYPGKDAVNLSASALAGTELGGRIAGRAPVVFLIDATWACSKVVLRESPGLLRLPRVMFEPSEPSRFYIKRQPQKWCLSTLEATHELLLALEAAGLDSYPDKTRLIAAFMKMQAYQAERAANAGSPRYRAKSK